MPRYKDYDYQQCVMVPVSFDRQILPGTFEHSVNYLVDEKLDLSIFDSRYKNDDTGRPAYDPAILLKIVLLAYSRGVTSSRKIEALCRENIVFMAISADSRPHFTSIAHFISGCPEQIASLFQQIILICDDLGLIGKEMFAVDGCKMPSNASKEWSGTRAELQKKAQKIDRAVHYLLKKHRDEDKKGHAEESIRRREEQQVEKLQAASQKIEQFLADNAERLGRSGKPVKGNITDNDSAKMKTSHGVLQGYTGVAAVDAKHQVVVHAEAFGTGDEHGLLEPMLDGLKDNLDDENILKRSQILADSGFHSTATLTRLEDEGNDAYIADNRFRSRDPRFADASRYKPVSAPRARPKARFTAEDFQADIDKKTCRCPAGKTMWLKSERARITGRIFMQFQAHQADCAGCLQRAQCLRSPTQKTARQVYILREVLPKVENGPLVRMKEKIDSPVGRHIYGRRLGIVEPVFGHLRENLGLRRFSLRGRDKVDGQWKLMTMLHNLTKIHRYGLAI
jgi:transposase